VFSCGASASTTPGRFATTSLFHLDASSRARASSSPRQMLRRCEGRGVEQQVGSGVGVVLLPEDVVAAGAALTLWERERRGFQGWVRAGGGGRGGVEVAARGGLER
jgi:hypothetical protein